MASEEGQKIKGKFVRLEEIAQPALSDLLRYFIRKKTFKDDTNTNFTTSNNPDRALAEYLEKKPSVFKIILKFMNKQQKSYFLDCDGIKLKQIIKISQFDTSVLCLLLFNICDFETCYANVVNNSNRRQRRCNNANHNNVKKCCIDCEHSDDFCKGCSTARHICKDNKSICCSKCTLCVNCSRKLATPPCVYQQLRSSIHIIHILRNFTSHTVGLSWQHFSQNSFIPGEFKFCGNTWDDIWNQFKKHVECLFKYLKTSKVINEEFFNEKMHCIFQLDHLTDTEEAIAIAKSVLKNQEATLQEGKFNKLRIKLAIVLAKDKDINFFQKLLSNPNKKNRKHFEKCFQKRLDSEFVINTEKLLKETLHEELEKHATSNRRPIADYRIFCKSVGTEKAGKSNSKLFVTVCIQNIKKGEKMSEYYQHPRSDMSKALWETFKEKLEKSALEEMNLHIVVEREGWKFSSVILTLQIQKISGENFNVLEKSSFLNLIYDLNNDKSLASFKITAVIQDNLPASPQTMATLSFSCELHEEYMYQVFMDVYAGFEKKLQQRFYKMKEKTEQPSCIKDLDAELKITQYAFKDIIDTVPPHIETLSKGDKSLKGRRHVITDTEDDILQLTHASIGRIDYETGFIHGVFMVFRSWYDELVYGVVAGRHCLYFQFLENGEQVHINTPQDETVCIDLTNQVFRFTCPLLNVTFLRFNADKVHELYSKGVVFLHVNHDYVRGTDEIYHILKTSDDKTVGYQQNSISTCWGFTIQQETSSLDDEIEPIFDINRNGMLEAISLKQQNIEGVLSSVRCTYIVYAINLLLNSALKIKDASHFYSPAKRLSDKEIRELGQMGLHFTQNEYLFVSPESFLVTTLWFFRSNHCWYWTPTGPKTYTNLDDLRYCNWLQIGVGRSMKVLGGTWQDCEPADRNIALINKLAETRLKYLA